MEDGERGGDEQADDGGGGVLLSPRTSPRGA